MKNKIQQKGFTLIELLVVIVILGILSTISVGTFRSYFAKARDSERVSTVQNLAMMIKVDSGGAGDCTVYNYATGGTDCGTDVSASLGLKDLLADNDYSMPETKNGLSYFYVVNEGVTDGDNNFFVVVGAEEKTPQNGKKIVGTTNYVFIDGTTKGITSGTAGADVVAAPPVLGTCDWDTTNNAPDCSTAVDWDVYKINPLDGTLAAWTAP